MLDRPTLSRLDLEDLISEAGTAGAVIDVIADMLNTCRVKSADDPGVRSGYVVFRLTRAQERALFAATTQASDTTQRLEAAFYADQST